MGRNKEILSLLLLSIINLSYARVFYNVLKQEDVCINGCKETKIEPDGKSVLTCCQRGCRFFNLVNVRRELKPHNLNYSLNACDDSCTEAYLVLEDLTACRIGCALMAIQHVNNLSPFSISMYIENGVNPNILMMSSDIVENDILTDPEFGKELLSGWWDSNGFKLSETYFKTVPIDPEASEVYGISTEYLGENEKSTSIPGSDWLQCASHHTGIPRWMLALAMTTAVLAALWLFSTPEKASDSIEKMNVAKPNIPNKLTIYLPDETSLDKKAPPKYSDIVDIENPNLKV